MARVSEGLHARRNQRDPVFVCLALGSTPISMASGSQTKQALTVGMKELGRGFGDLRSRHAIDA